MLQGIAGKAEVALQNTDLLSRRMQPRLLGAQYLKGEFVVCRTGGEKHPRQQEK